MRQEIKTLGGQIRAAATRLATAAADPSTPSSELTVQRDTLNSMNGRMEAMQAAFDAQYGESVKKLPKKPKAQKPPKSPSLKKMLGSREYARAFADGMRTGAQPKRMTDEKHKVLYDALTIAGDPAGGQDGGFLVPEDVDHNIRELRRELNPLADLFTEEDVSTNSGWRVMDKAPSMGFTYLDGEIPDDGIAMDDQPEFVKVPFSLTTYGLILPVSSELASDEVASLFGYLARWFARKQIITENKLLKAQLDELTASVIEADEEDVYVLDKIKHVLNVLLDPAISLNAGVLTNQDGYNFLDTLKDADNRPLMQPDPTNATGMMLKGRPITMAPNWLLPTREEEYFPLYIGDFEQYATLFTRHPLEIRSTDIGGDAWRKNSIEVRGISRMSVAAFDAGAVVRSELHVP